MLDAGSTASLPFRSPLSDTEQDGTSQEQISGVPAGTQQWARPSTSLVWESVKDSLAKRSCLQRYGSLKVRHHLCRTTRKEISFATFHHVLPISSSICPSCNIFLFLLHLSTIVCHCSFQQMLLQSSCCRVPLISTITSINNLFPFRCSKACLW